MDTASYDNLNNQFRELSQRVANFIALQETAVNTITDEEKRRQQELIAFREEVDNQLQDIRSVLNEFQAMMTSVGVARFRVAAEEAMSQGKDHLRTLSKMADDFRRLTDEKSMRIEQMTQLAEKRISRVVRSLRLDYFRRLIDDGCERVDHISGAAVSRVSQVVKWFHWERLGIAFVVALVVGIVMGLFMNDEWPWETHQRVVTERDAGRMLLNAWPHLSKVEQDDIRRNANVS